MHMQASLTPKPTPKPTRAASRGLPIAPGPEAREAEQTAEGLFGTGRCHAHPEQSLSQEDGALGCLYLNPWVLSLLQPGGAGADRAGGNPWRESHSLGRAGGQGC